MSFYYSMILLVSTQAIRNTCVPFIDLILNRFVLLQYCIDRIRIITRITVTTVKKSVTTIKKSKSLHLLKLLWFFLGFFESLPLSRCEIKQVSVFYNFLFQLQFHVCLIHSPTCSEMLHWIASVCCHIRIFRKLQGVWGEIHTSLCLFFNKGNKIVILLRTIGLAEYSKLSGEGTMQTRVQQLISK